MQNNKKYVFLIIFYQNSIWNMIFIGVWITAVFQAALETYISECPVCRVAFQCRSCM